MNWPTRTCLVAFALIAGLATSSLAVIYVNQNGTELPDGLSWESGYRTIQAAIDAAFSDHEVWVATGTYDENIVLGNSVQLYGGFDGDEEFRSDRGIRAHVTTITTSNWPSACITGAPDTRVDGFTIADSYYGIKSDGSCPVIANNTMTNCTFGAYIADCASAAVDNNRFLGCGDSGVQLTNCVSPVLTGNAFTNTTYYPVRASGTMSGEWTMTGNTATGSPQGNGARLENVTLADNTRLGPSGDFPYMVVGITVPAGLTLTVDPGSVVKFDYWSSQITCYGTLSAAGTAESPIYFTSRRDDAVGGDTDDSPSSIPAPGDWGGIYIGGTGARGVFDHCVVRYGGCNGYNIGSYPGAVTTVSNSTIAYSNSYGLYYEGGSPQVTNCEVSNCISHGIRMTGCSSPKIDACVLGSNQTGLSLAGCSSPTIKDSTFTGNQYAAYVAGTTSGEFTVTGNSGAGNTYGNGVYFDGSSLNASTQFHPSGSFPYIIGGLTIPVAMNLTVDPGVVIKPWNTSSQITCYGRITAAGTAGSPVYFTSSHDDTVGGDTDNDTVTPAKGDWGGIFVGGLGSEGTFDHCVVRYGGYNGYNIGSYTDALVDVSNSTIAQSYSDGLYYEGGSPRVTNCDINNCTSHGIRMTGCSSPVIDTCELDGNQTGLSLINCSSPTITDSTFASNTYAAYVVGTANGEFAVTGNTGTGNACGNGVYFDGASMSADARFGASGDFPYIIGGLTIQAGGALTVDPGVAVKYWGHGSQITCYGKISAVGAAESPIHFTSSHDDTVGGDTDNDSVTPAKGDWGGIYIGGAGSQGTFDHCVVRYGGYNGWNIASYTDALVAVSNSTIAQSYSDGLCYEGGSPQVTKCDIADCSSHGIRMTGCSSPVIDTCTLGGNQTGLSLIGCTSPTIKDSAFSTNQYAAYVTGATSGEFTVTGNAGTGNAYGNGLYFDGASLSADTRFHPAGVFPHIIGSMTVQSGSTLTVDPGTVVKLWQNGSQITCYGDLRAIGTAEAPIYFTSRRDDFFAGDTDGDNGLPARGDWGAIYIAGSGAKGTFERCVLSYGGCNGANVMCSSGALDIRQCTVTGSYSSGVQSDAFGQVITNCIVSNNNDYGVNFTNTYGRIAYCDIGVNGSGNNAQPPSSTPGTIWDDPLFFAPGASDYRLADGSPCINTGDPAIFDADGSRSDMGALGTVESVISAKIAPDGRQVTFSDVECIAGNEHGGTFIYVENANRTCGIKVMTSTPVSMGQHVWVEGTTATIDGERAITESTVSTSQQVAYELIKPLCMPNKTVGGGNWRYDAGTGAGQRGIEGASGLNNIGLLVRTTGAVTYVDARTFILDDGSAVSVKVVTPSGFDADPDWTHAGVTGVSSTEMVDGKLLRVLRVRYGLDVTPSE